MELKFTVQMKIQKPVSEVFDAVYNPKKLCAYFTAESEGPLDEGKTVLWTHASGECSTVSMPVKVQKMVPNKLIRFSWAASEGYYDAKTGQFPHSAGYDNLVEMAFEELKPGETLVKITEGNWRPNEDGLQSSYQNCQGWAGMVACMKAYLEYGINLRSGAY